MAAAVAGLIGLGNTVTEAAELTEQTEGEIRRLRKLAAARTSAAANGDQDAAGEDVGGEDVGGRDDTAQRAGWKAFRSTSQPTSQPSQAGTDGAGQDTLAFDAAVPVDARS